jgi:DNA-binding transcriptional LysR family regulator
MVFHLVTGYVETLHRELSGRNVDLLIARRFGPIAEERLDFQFLFDDSSVVAAVCAKSMVRRRSIEFAELSAESWVLPPPGSEIASIAMEAFRASGVDYPRRTVVTDSPHARNESRGDRAICTILPASALKFSRHAPRDQDLAPSTCQGPRTKRNRHPAEPRGQPRRTNFSSIALAKSQRLRESENEYFALPSGREPNLGVRRSGPWHGCVWR